MFKIAIQIAGLILLCIGSSQAASWRVEMIDQSGPGKFTSLKIDRFGNAHLAYVAEDGKNTLKYAFWDRGLDKWFIMNVAEGAAFSSLVLDSKQRPHISWNDYGTIPGCKLRYAYFDGESWKTQAIPLSADTVAFYTSIVLDSHDYPSISFYEYDGPRGTDFRVRMRVVSYNGVDWQVTTIDGSNQSGKFNSMDTDPNGYAQLAYANVNAGTAGMRYAYFDGKGWKVEPMDGREQNNGESVGFGAFIKVDREGDPHVTYMNYTTPAVKYSVRTNGVWQSETVESLSGVAYPDRNSLALDADERPYIGYFDPKRGVLKVAHKQGAKWVGEIVDSQGAGYTSSLQIARGTLWISYTDERNGGVKVARRELDPGESAARPGATSQRGSTEAPVK